MGYNFKNLFAYYLICILAHLHNFAKIRWNKYFATKMKSNINKNCVNLFSVLCLPLVLFFLVLFLWEIKFGVLHLKAVPLHMKSAIFPLVCLAYVRCHFYSQTERKCSKEGATSKLKSLESKTTDKLRFQTIPAYWGAIETSRVYMLAANPHVY